MSVQEHSRAPHAPFKRAAAWMVAVVAICGALLAWASIQGGNVSRWLPQPAAIHKANAALVISAAGTKDALTRGARIQTTQCAGCHDIEQRSTAPSYQEIVDHYKGQGESVLADLAEAVNHPSPGWSGYSPGPPSGLPQSDRVAVAYWLMNSSRKGTN